MDKVDDLLDKTCMYKAHSQKEHEEFDVPMCLLTVLSCMVIRLGIVLLKARRYPAFILQVWSCGLARGHRNCRQSNQINQKVDILADGLRSIAECVQPHFCSWVIINLVEGKFGPGH